MRRVPGITFVDSPAGRRPVVAGTGIDVWEAVATWLAVQKDFPRLRAAYQWLTEPQLRAALAYYDRCPKAIDERIAREEAWTPDRVWKELPFTARRP